jgi:hypothetical protein
MISPPVAIKMYRMLTKEWAVQWSAQSSRYDPAIGAALRWAKENTSTLVTATEKAIVFRDETDALMYYMAHKA